MARPGEERGLYALLRQGLKDVGTELHALALKSGNRHAVESVEIQSPFGIASTDIIAHPMKDGTLAIIFVLKDQLQPAVQRYAVPPTSGDQRVADLQERLSDTQKQLNSRMEEVGTANEELKSSNEEMMSMNEELQSANEELTTANEELKNKIDELTLANADLDNFLRSASLAMIVVDRSLRVRHITEAAGTVLPIKQTDKGRFLNEFNLGLEGIDLSKHALNIMKSGESHSETARSRMPGMEGASFYTRVTPYFFKDRSIEGATITLTEITEEVALRRELELETSRLATAMSAGRMGLSELDIEKGAVVVDTTLAEHLNLKRSGEVTMQEFLSSIHPEDQLKLQCIFIRIPLPSHP